MTPVKKSPAKPKAAKPTLNPDRRVELLFEIGAEEIPAGMLPRAVTELQAILERHLAAENYQQGVTIETFGGPRRLTAWVRGLVAKQADVENEVTGPPKSVAYDANGAATRAAVSFAERQGVPLHAVYLVQTPKGEYIAAKVTKRGRTAHELLLEILPRVIHDLPWPRMTVIRISSGSSRNAGSKLPSITWGNSLRYVTSCSRSGSGWTWKPVRLT